jgi:hypothetical protein
MQAKQVHFERGGDPKDVIRIGDVKGRAFARAKVEISKEMDRLVTTYGGTSRIYGIYKTREQEGIRGSWNPGRGYRYVIDFSDTNEDYFYFPEKYTIGGEWRGTYGGRKSAREAADELIAQWGGKISEAQNFERGMEPKRAMKVGHHRNDLFNEIKSMSFEDATEYFPELGSDTDQKILILAAHMLKVSEKEVRIAMDGDAPIYSDNPLMDEYLSRDWQYGKEDSLESTYIDGSIAIFDLIGSSTGEIYVKDSKSDEFLYILGAIN